MLNTKVKLVLGGAAVAAVVACAHGNAAVAPATPTPDQGGNFLPLHLNQLQQSAQPMDHCGESRLIPCDKGGAQ